MKDYRLSEIKEICEEKCNSCSLKEIPCKSCKMQEICKTLNWQKYHRGFSPNNWKLEPRDIIELPCKGIVHSSLGDALVICYRNHNGEILIMPFTEEETANKFLEELKGASK